MILHIFLYQNHAILSIFIINTYISLLLKGLGKICQFHDEKLLHLPDIRSGTHKQKKGMGVSSTTLVFKWHELCIFVTIISLN